MEFSLGLPKCQSPLSRIDVSRWHAGRVREGYRPHPRRWRMLAELWGLGAQVSNAIKRQNRWDSVRPL